MALGFKNFTPSEAISKGFRENANKQSGQHSVTLKDDLGAPVYFPDLSVTNPIDNTAFDLNASAFSQATNISNDYIFDSVELNFSTTESKTITITSSDGTILWGGSADTSSNNLGYNTTKKHFNLCFGQAFNGGENLTVAVTQTAGACSMDCILKVKQGSENLAGNPSLGAGNEIIGKVDINSQLDPNLEIGKGNVSNHSSRGIFAYKNATTTESTVSANLTGRYPFPSARARMTVVSTSANDTSAGTGLRVLMVSGLTEDVAGVWVEDTELILMTGTVPVTTTKYWRRVNDIVGISVGSTGSNEGTITLLNGADVLQSMVIGENTSNSLIWSVASNSKHYVTFLSVSSGKSAQNATFTLYMRSVTPTTLPMIVPFKMTAYGGQYFLPFEVPFLLAGGTDLETTCKTDGGTIKVNAYFAMTKVEE